MWCADRDSPGVNYTLEFNFSSPMMITGVKIRDKETMASNNTGFSFGYFMDDASGYQWTDYDTYGDVVGHKVLNLLIAFVYLIK